MEVIGSTGKGSSSLLSIYSEGGLVMNRNIKATFENSGVKI